MNYSWRTEKMGMGGDPPSAFISACNPVLVEGKVHELEAPASDLEIRALNPDHSLEITQLIALYRRCYGDDYPFQRVYKRHFWSRQGGTQARLEGFLNLIARKGSHLFGHLGLRLNPSQRRAAIISVAIEHLSGCNIFRSGNLAWETISKLSQRQKWQSLLFFCPLAQASLQALGTKCFHAHELAILPHQLPHESGVWGYHRSSPEDRGVLMMYTPLQSSRGQACKLYPPQQHQDMIAELYAPLGLKRRFGRGVRSDSNLGRGAWRSRTTLQDPLQSSGLCLKHQPKYGVLHIDLEPSHVLNPTILAEQLLNLEKQRSARIFINVRLDDSSCPRISRLLEDLGFRFCGILPNIEGRDALLYSRFGSRDLECEQLYSTRAKRLHAYIRGFAPQ